MRTRADIDDRMQGAHQRFTKEIGHFIVNYKIKHRVVCETEGGGRMTTSGGCF